MNEQDHILDEIGGRFPLRVRHVCALDMQRHSPCAKDGQLTCARCDDDGPDEASSETSCRACDRPRQRPQLDGIRLVRPMRFTTSEIVRGIVPGRRHVGQWPCLELRGYVFVRSKWNRHDYRERREHDALHLRLEIEPNGRLSAVVDHVDPHNPDWSWKSALQHLWFDVILKTWRRREVSR